VLGTEIGGGLDGTWAFAGEPNGPRNPRVTMRFWLHNPGARPVRGVAGEEDASVGGLDGPRVETKPELELVREVVAATCPLRLKVVPAGLRLSIHAQRAARRGAPRNGCRWARAF